LARRFALRCGVIRSTAASPCERPFPGVAFTLFPPPSRELSENARVSSVRFSLQRFERDVQRIDAAAVRSQRDARSPSRSIAV
jgi:hypothetical protein